MKSRRTFIKATVLSTALASIGLTSFGALAADTIKCYEIYGFDKAGKKVEIYFNPETAAVLETK